MQITNMKQVKENIGKRIRFQYKSMKEPVTGVIVFGTTEDCEGDLIGLSNNYSIVYDQKATDGGTYGTLLYDDEYEFDKEEFLEFETIEE